MSPAKVVRFLTPWRLRLVGVFLLSIVAFAPTLAGRLIWDDRVWFHGQSADLSRVLWGPTFNKFWRPLPAFTFWLEKKAIGVYPAFAHSVNLILHAATALIVVGIALLLTKRRDLALWAGAIFAVQPAQIVPTGWIGGRNDLLCAITAAVFIYGLLLWHQERRASWLIASCVGFFLCMLGKENTVALLFAVPLIALWTGQKRDMRLTLPVFTAVAALFLYLWVTHAPHEPWGHYNAGRQAGFTLAGAVHYGMLLTIPNSWSLSMYEPSPLMGIGWLAFGAAILVGCAVFLWRAPRLYALLLALALIAWLPNSNIVPIPSMPLAPYRSAVSGIFIAILLGACLRPVVATSLIAACLFMCVWHSATTLLQPVPFFRAMVRYDPGFDIAWDNLTYVLVEQAKGPEAVQASRDCLVLFAGSADLDKEPDWDLAARRLDPCLGWRNLRTVVAGMYARYGDALFADGQNLPAEHAYEKSVGLHADPAVRRGLERVRAKIGAQTSARTVPRLSHSRG